MQKLKGHIYIIGDIFTMQLTGLDISIVKITDTTTLTIVRPCSRAFHVVRTYRESFLK
jgi:hypothetical protein